MEKTHAGYKTLALSLTLSFIVMYLVMFLNIDDVSHFHISLTRAYMALLMVSPMALIMLLLMREMFPSKSKNRLIAGASVIVFVAALSMLRNQVFISDRMYMKAMIPHHSSAILTSRYASLHDPAVKQLSERIIQSQREEIAQMERALERIK